MKDLKIFKDARFGQIRTSVSESGEPLFCLVDVCKALDLSNASKVKQRLQPRGVSISYAPTYNQYGALVMQQLNFIDEPNLYKCIFQSRKEDAEQFQDWVCGEVLPSIRKSGGYVVARQEDSPEVIMARALQIANETIERSRQRVQMLEGENESLQEQNRLLAPKARYTDEVLQSGSTYTLTQVAHDLGMRSVHCLTAELTRLRILFKQSGQYQPTAKVAQKGYFKTRTAKYVKADGTVGTSLSTVVTERGRVYLHQVFSK